MYSLILCNVKFNIVAHPIFAVYYDEKFVQVESRYYHPWCQNMIGPNCERTYSSRINSRVGRSPCSLFLVASSYIRSDLLVLIQNPK